ncbi:MULTISPECIES: hypothetical protein [Streptomyces violaceusniger group]|uniref:Two-component sensor histidine kinase n=2 Tax=Streptomyces rhizosphaericus TaxID=114699 RepID=A0ABP3ZWK4_9ACTN|nr:MULTISPECIES: hypothetical protein [Streptomyces violaceusniger group]
MRDTAASAASRRAEAAPVPRYRLFRGHGFSLRIRLTVAATVVAALGLSLAAVLLVVSQHAPLIHSLD